MKKPSKIEAFNKNLALAKEDRKIPTGIDVSLAIDEQHIENCLQRGELIAEDIGKTLAKIQAEKKYPERSFKLYVKRRWSKSVSWGYKMIESYKSVENFTHTSVDNKQLRSQSQVSALSKAPPEKQKEILDEVAKEGKVTAEKIIAKTKEKEPAKEATFRDVVKDANGDEVPEGIVKEFERAERESKEQISNAQQIKNFLERDDLITTEARGLRETAKDLLAGLKTRLTKHVLCPKCNGKKCAVCSKRGFVSNHFATKGIGK